MSNRQESNNNNKNQNALNHPKLNTLGKEENTVPNDRAEFSSYEDTIVDQRFLFFGVLHGDLRVFNTLFLKQPFLFTWVWN